MNIPCLLYNSDLSSVGCEATDQTPILSNLVKTQVIEKKPPDAIKLKKILPEQDFNVSSILTLVFRP